MTFLDAADQIGAKLHRDAVWAGCRCNWIGPSMEFVDSEWRVVHRACGGDLYNGTSGIALFLWRLAAVTGEAAYRRTADGAIEQALGSAAFHQGRSVGFYSGLTGISFAAHCMGRHKQAQSLLESAFHTAPGAQDIDVVSGVAGAIPALLSIKSELALRHATQCGDHLLACATTDGEMYSWDTVGASARRHLTGYSHGASGIAHALLELYSVVHEDRFRDAAERALGYEHRWYDPARGNWPDFRSDAQGGGNEPAYGLAWCHGAPGIGLARLRAYEILGHEDYRKQAEIALSTTAAQLAIHTLSAQNLSLCHGACGNAELLIAASTVFGADHWMEQARDVGRYGIETFLTTRTPWPCGVLGAGETPNLMLGVAGIGYFYLRLHDPAHVPSVLLVTAS